LIEDARMALRNRRNVKGGTRHKLEAAAGKRHQTARLAAPGLGARHADAIGVFSSTMATVTGRPARFDFVMEIATSAARYAFEKGMALVVAHPRNMSTNGPNVDGAIVIEPLEYEPAVLSLQSRGVKVVSIGGLLGKTCAPCVDLQHYDAATVVIKHLYELSHGKLGLVVGSQPRFTHLQTELAYRDFVNAHGQEAIVRRIDETTGSKGAYDVTNRLLSENPELDALYISVDAFAVGARRAAADLGIDIPGELKIATRYDGLLARESDPQLTALNLHLDAVANLAIDLLFEHMSGRSVRTSVTGPCATLVPRESTCTC
jgi:DNA-binding LacI/PurR family transcriptional regulator